MMNSPKPRTGVVPKETNWQEPRKQHSLSHPPRAEPQEQSVWLGPSSLQQLLLLEGYIKALPWPQGQPPLSLIYREIET